MQDSAIHKVEISQSRLELELWTQVISFSDRTGL